MSEQPPPARVSPPARVPPPARVLPPGRVVPPGRVSPPARVLRGRNRIGGSDDLAQGRDARARIQDAALELFIRDGYDKTSLREIAEKLGVTKAALYYHFPTKEDIVNSLIDERLAKIGALIAWAEQQPKTAEMRLEFVRRYSADLHGGRRHEHIMRFFERNQTLVNTLSAGQRMRDQMRRVFDLLTDPDEPLALQLKRALAIFAIHAGWFILNDREATDEERQRASLQVATELLSDPGEKS